MPADAGPVLWPAAAASLALLAIAAQVEAWRRLAPDLPPPSASPEPTTLLLAVRDEEADLPGCLAGLQRLHGLTELRIVDDGSVDDTWRLIARAAQDDPRIRPLQAGPLPAGWRGKPHALAVGAAGATTPWLLLTDADVRHHPELLPRLQAAAARWRLDLVSVAGRQHARGLGETLLTPPAFALLDAELGDWEEAARSLGEPVANGQLILVRRRALEAIGGFDAIRDAVLDDVALARRLRSAGYRTGFVRAPNWLKVRMYRGLAESLRGWRRILGARYAERPGSGLAVAVLLLAPVALLLAALATGRWSAAALLWGGGAAASALLRSGAAAATTAAVLFPLDAAALGTTLLAALADVRTGRLAPWKRRALPMGDRG